MLSGKITCVLGKAMSDIDLNNMDWLLGAFAIICLLGPPVVIGGLLLLIGIWVRDRWRLTGFYFALSIPVVLGISIWMVEWLNVPDYLVWTLPLSVASAGVVFGAFRFFGGCFEKLGPRKLRRRGRYDMK
jgi:hypothetical protein